MSDLSPEHVEEDLINRTEIILEQSILLFNRLESNISALKSRILTFFGVVVGIYSIQLALLEVVGGVNIIFSVHYIFFLIVFLVTIIISIAILIRLCRSNVYRDIEIFKANRLQELTTFNRKDLVSDFLFYYKKSYEFNKKQYNKDIDNFILAYEIFVIELISYSLLIALLWIR